MALYNTKSGGDPVNLTDQQYASLSPDMRASLSPVQAQPAPQQAKPTTTPVTSSIASPAPAPVNANAPTLPTPTAPQTQETYMLSAAEQAKQARTNLDTTYKKQSEDVQNQIDVANTNIAGITAKQQDTLTNDVQPLLQPFRSSLETAQRKQLSVDTNFQANQALVGELDALLTQGNNLVKQQQGLPVIQKLIDGRVSKAMSDISARAGVIQAVMAARNSQISVAENMIDRSVQAMTADRQDQLKYYQTVLDFYQTAKDEEGKKLFKLDAKKEELITSQMGLLENDLKQAQVNADHIKSLMTDPDTASFMAQAGVTLNDTPDQVNAKMAAQAQRQQVQDTKNKLVGEGYTFVPAPTGAADEVQFTIGNQTMTFKQPESMKLDLEAKRASIRATNALAGQRSGGGGGTGGGGTFTNDLDAIIGTTLSTIPTKFGQATFQQQIHNARNDADKINIVAAQVLKAQGAEIKKDFANQAVGISEIDKALALLDQGVKTGAVNNAAQYTFNVFGKDFDPKLAQINQHLIAAIQPYRNSVTGAAWGTQEDNEYAQMFGSTRYSPTELRQRLEGIKEILTSKSATTLNAFVNPMGTYDNPFTTPQAPDTGVEQNGILSTFDSVLGTTATPQSNEGYWSNLWGNAKSFAGSLFGS